MGTCLAFSLYFEKENSLTSFACVVNECVSFTLLPYINLKSSELKGSLSQSNLHRVNMKRFRLDVLVLF